MLIPAQCKFSGNSWVVFTLSFSYFPELLAELTAIFSYVKRGKVSFSSAALSCPASTVTSQDYANCAVSGHQGAMNSFLYTNTSISPIYIYLSIHPSIPDLLLENESEFVFLRCVCLPQFLYHLYCQNVYRGSHQHLVLPNL